jgi:hypothetical protein
MGFVGQHTSDVKKKKRTNQVKQESRMDKEDGNAQNRMGIH